jgi:ATP-dependent RNA helicase DDX18/HAS1
VSELGYTTCSEI